MTSKTITIADPQLIAGGGDVTRDALGLSIGSELSEMIQGYSKSQPEMGMDGIKKIYTYKYRMFGSDAINTDKEWLSFINGGMYADETYAGIFSNATFLDHHHVESAPYTELETRKNGTYNTRNPVFISCKPEMNAYYSNYERSIEDTTDVTNIPNAYKILERLNPTRTSLGPKRRKGITDDFKLGQVEVNQTASLLRNVFVTNEEAYANIETAIIDSDLLPYYVKTIFDFGQTGQFLSKVFENNFQHRFVKLLKDSFLSEDGATAPIDVTFNLESSFINESKEPEVASTSTTLKAVDVFDMMNYSLTNYNTEVENFEYLFDESEIARSQYNSNSVRRFEKTIPTIRQTNSLIELLDSTSYVNTFKLNPINLQEKQNEIVAYRIEKIGGQVTGDSFTQDQIQNFWFLNVEDVDRFEFLDNQVMLNNDYTYNIYKYVLVSGIEYTYSDLAVTRTIANLNLDDIGPSQGWCLEFFDPETGESSAPVFDDGFGGVESIRTIGGGNTLATAAQVQSEKQYLADFKLTVSPSIKIVEVPIMSKALSIVDSPPNPVQISPSYLVDDSNMLQFMIRYDVKVPASFPTPISLDDAEYKQKFLNSYDLLESDLVRTETASLPVILQIYRIEEMPRSISDFDGNLLATKSLRIPNQDSVFNTIVCLDKVSPNKKYFYLFRIVNETGIGGFNSNIIEAELVSDGGYKFANFEAYFENELSQKTLSRIIKSFKKLLHIRPSLENLMIDDSEADYSDLAKNQIGNIKYGNSTDSIWGRKFKIRLTSKKTGKKIDINITHKLNG